MYTSDDPSEATTETGGLTVEASEATADPNEALAYTVAAETGEATADDAETGDVTAEASEATVDPNEGPAYTVAAETIEATADDAETGEMTAEPYAASVETVDANTVEADPLSTFASWLRGLGNETEALSRLIEREDAPESLRRFAARALNQLLHVAELVPEGIEALGYLEALFVSRLLAAQACQEHRGLAAQDPSGTLGRLAADAAALAEFLGEEDCARLASQVDAQRQRRTRGRSANELVDVAEARAEALAEARTWARSYRAPAFGAGSHDLVKLRAFVHTRVRSAAA